MQKVELSYIMEVNVRNLKDKLIVDYILKQGEEELTTFTYIYTEESLTIINEIQSRKRNLKDKKKKLVKLLREYLVDILKSSFISPLKKYNLLVRYMRNISRYDGKIFVENLICQLKELEIEEKSIKNSEAKWIYNININVTNLPDKLVIDYKYIFGNRPFKTSSYIYTEEGVKIISNVRSTYKKKLKDKLALELLKKYIIDILRSSSVTPLEKYMFLTEYLHSSRLGTKNFQYIIKKLVEKVNMERDKG